ncbi:Alpha/beta hydrolase fold-1 [Aspergillus sergii]|uniref:Alpha/beta hydrolase fold-1 n=1 Tax=Aspergillus sergii TaxID=1034303 RepID=A0A5N6WWR9_9EURO|nr:Alpha/beta hydrolase fold-1 [Aspergillus sergii]
MSRNPTILIIPGLWEGPTVFNPVSALLTASNLKTEIATLPSTGTISPGNPSLKDDVLAVRTHIEKLVQQGENVLLVLHSAGGFIGSEAMEGLTEKDREARGLSGGVVGIVFVAAAVVEKGYVHGDLPFSVVEGGALHCVQPEQTLFNDLNEEEKGKWLEVLRPQPAQGWNAATTYAGWKEVKSVYLVCEEDQVIPAFLQEELAGLAGSRVQRCNAGHMPHLSQPSRVVEVIKDAVAAFT